MDPNELAELQDPNTWEDTGDDVRRPAKPARAVVSVGFSRDEFHRVADFARRNDMKTSEFIRKAALERLAPPRPESAVLSVTGAVRTGHPPEVDARAKVVVVTSAEDDTFATA